MARKMEPDNNYGRKRTRPTNHSGYMISDAMTGLFPEISFSDGAIEGLKICFEQFLSSVGDHLAREERYVVQPNEIVEAVEAVGLADLADDEVVQSIRTSRRGKKTKRIKRFQWTKEMEEEQERLLLASKKVVGDVQQSIDKKPQK